MLGPKYILVQGVRVYSPQSGAIAQTPWVPTHCRPLHTQLPHLPLRPARCAAMLSLSHTPWRRCLLRSAQQADGEGADTGLLL